MAGKHDGRGAADSGANELNPSESAVAKVFREEASGITSTLVRLLGDFALAEEAVQDALVAALEHWPAEGVPDRPGAWLFTVARRKALDSLRRDSVYREKLMQVEWPLAQEPDDRLRLIFTCCHPALSREAQVALTLRAVCGLTTDQIARAFLTSEATIAKRIVRARRKIVDAGIPYRLPRPENLEERIGEVLAVLYLTFNEGYLATSGPLAERRDLAEDAAWLTALLSRLLPGHAEVLGLLALMQLHLARASARFGAQGDLVLMQNQDRSRWDKAKIQSALATLDEAAKLNRLGIYQLQAAIVACHAEADSWGKTDWRQIVALYERLYEIAPTPVVQLNRAIAVAQLHGAAEGLHELEGCAERLDGYALYHSARALMLAQLGDRVDERSELRRALELTGNAAERRLIERRLAENPA
jgi:RNA polymerase sigma-70 factor (ECF subfamily)